MAQDTPPKTPKSKAELRAERLKAALKSNMGRRKAQSRARQAQTQENNAPSGANEESG